MASELTDDQWAQIDAEIVGGRTISAIKLHRDFSGSGLKEAKDAVEARIEEALKTDPKRFAAAKKGTGCMPVLLVFSGVSFYVLLRILA